MPGHPTRQNYGVPSLGRAVRIVDLAGNSLVADHSSWKRGKWKLVYRKFSFAEQLKRSYELLDANFSLLEHHRDFKQGKCKCRPVAPSLEIPCRDRNDFQAGNWSRFASVWMIYLSEFSGCAV